MHFQLDDLPYSAHFVPALDRRRKQYKRVGSVYAMRNRGLPKSHLKIGMTSRYPWVRQQELSRSTAIPTPFELVYYISVAERRAAEAYAHQLLQRYRVAPNKEFFTSPIKEMLDAFQSVADRFPIYVVNKRGLHQGVYPQDLSPVTLPCASCGQLNRVQRLLIPTRQRCHDCKTPIDVKALLPRVLRW